MGEQPEIQNSQKIYVEKKRRGIPQVLVVVIVAVITSFVSTAMTYVLLKKDVIPESVNEGVTKKIEITKVDSPVVAIAEKAMPSIVGIKVNSFVQGMFGLQESNSEGSGIIYSEDGYIITNYHVIESAIRNNSASVYVTFYNTDEEIQAEIIGGDEVTDLAVLKIEKEGLVPAEIGSSESLKVGEL